MRQVTPLSTTDVNSGGDCMKMFNESLKDHAMKIVNIEAKKMMPLTTKSSNHRLVKKSAIYAKKILRKTTLIIAYVI